MENFTDIMMWQLSPMPNIVLYHYMSMYIYIYIYPGPGLQPSTVIISGVAVSFTVTFPPGQILVQLPVFDIIDDTTALETNEVYQLRFIRSTPSQNVTLGNPTTITITDDDGELNYN